jgi:hypothetical protein
VVARWTGALDMTRLRQRLGVSEKES